MRIYIHVCQFVRKSAYTITGFEKLHGSHLHTEKPEGRIWPKKPESSGPETKSALLCVLAYSIMSASTKNTRATSMVLAMYLVSGSLIGYNKC